MEQIGLSMSTTCLGELQKLLAAWQTPRLWAWQRKPLRHSQRALSTSGEHPKHHNLSEQTALLFISPHLLWGSGMRKGESVNRNGMQHSMQYLFGIVCGSKKFGIWEENFLDRVKHSSVLYSYFWGALFLPALTTVLLLQKQAKKKKKTNTIFAKNIENILKINFRKNMACSTHPFFFFLNVICAWSQDSNFRMEEECLFKL